MKCSNPSETRAAAARQPVYSHNHTQPPCVRRSTQPPTLAGMGSVADWGGGMSAGCTAGPIVRWHGQWMAT